MSQIRTSLSLSIADKTIDGVRLDRFLSEGLELFTRSQIAHHAVEVSVNGKPSKLSRKVSARDRLEISYTTPEPVSYAPEPMDLNIIFEDANVVVLNKPLGIVVHPAAGNHTGTLVQGLLHHCKEMGGLFGDEVVRPGIVHRLDKDTSGVLIAAKHPRAQEFLAAQFRRKKTEKKYYALIKGSFARAGGEIETFLVRDRKNRKRFVVSDSEGKQAKTVYRSLKRWDRYSFVSLSPITGRTHQLRVHMKHLGHPIVGDPTYGRKDNALPDAELMLHAYSLKIRLPGEQEPRTFRAPLPDRMKKLILSIENQRKPG